MATRLEEGAQETVARAGGDHATRPGRIDGGRTQTPRPEVDVGLGWIASTPSMKMDSTPSVPQ